MQTDVAEVYLNSGHIRIPDTVILPKLPFEVADQVSHALATILNAKVRVHAYMYLLLNSVVQFWILAINLTIGKKILYRGCMILYEG